MDDHNIISVSGGKDSTALLLLAIERNTKNLSAVFADTGNEHQITLDYVAYLNAEVFPIRTLRADFTRLVAGKRDYIAKHWEDKGVPPEVCMEAIEALKPTGNPFLDMCLWKGMFPSRTRAFCSEELKRNPIINEVQKPLLDAGHDVVSWQGVRRDESIRRKFLAERELKTTHANGSEMWNYRPILDWKAEDCFAMHKKHGVRHNPLYEMGMGRVGCMPCINAAKSDIGEIAARFPEHIDRIEEWERIVSQVSRRGLSSFFPTREAEIGTMRDRTTIRLAVEWASTTRGGTQRDLLATIPPPACSSSYGLCE